MITFYLISFIGAYFLFKFIWFCIRHAEKRRFFSHFPQRYSHFFLGETLLFKLNPLTEKIIPTLIDLTNEVNPADKIGVGWITTIPFVFIFNRDYIKEILKSNDEHLLNKGAFLYGAVDEMMPNCIFTVKGDQWRTRRKILSEPFHSTSFNSLAKIIEKEAKKVVEYLRTNPCKDTLHEMKKFSLSVFCSHLFDYDLGDEVDDGIKVANKAFDMLTRKTFSIHLASPFLYRFTSIAREEAKVLKDLMDFKNKMINSKKDILKDNLKTKLESKNEDLNAKTHFSLIEILLKNLKTTTKKSPNGQFDGFDSTEVRSQMDIFIIAGLDTLSTAITFLLYHLAKYPQYQTRIYNEIQDIYKGDRDCLVPMEDIKKFPLLEAFVKESLRIRPPAPVVSRNVTKEMIFDGKYKVPKGTDVVILIEKLVKDPDYWKEPLRFWPERFFEDQSDNFYANIPFSQGSRNCIAKRLSVQMISLLAIYVLRNYEVHFTSNTPKEITLQMMTWELFSKPIKQLELKFVERK